MPRETVGTGTWNCVSIGQLEDDTPAHTPQRRPMSLSVGWNKDAGWVQVYLIPSGWEHTGQWQIVDLGPDEVDHMMRVLRRAKRQAYPRA